MLTLGCNLKLLADDLSKNGKVVTTKDLSNIKSSASAMGDVAKLDEIESLLQKYGNYLNVN